MMQPMLNVPFSPKQLRVLRWWQDSRDRKYDAVICDGAVRSGKTTALALGFFLWASACFHHADFALCGKTKTSLRRNLLDPMLILLREVGFSVTEKRAGGYVEIGFGRHINRFYYFGGRDESAAALIQGMTLAGVLLDETALMPRSFVELGSGSPAILTSRHIGSIGNGSAAQRRKMRCICILPCAIIRR